MYIFKPKKIYYENEIKNYELGKYLLEKYSDLPKVEITSHNNILELRKKSNKDFVNLKDNLIIGVRKSLRFIPNKKVSDFLVPYTSSGCSAMCLYCYLVCTYNKCAYLRLFVNREQMLDKIIRKAKDLPSDTVFEIGSNSDLVLENVITKNLEWTIEKFSKLERGYITLPTKFDMIDSLLNLEHKGRCIIRMSLNPDYIIKRVEFRTSALDLRINAINKLVDAGYIVGVIVAPIIMIEDWQTLYYDLISYLRNNLSSKARESIFFEAIFMTYSFVHNAINKEAFPNALPIFSKETMRGRGRGKYCYKEKYLYPGKEYIRDVITRFFPNNKIYYII